MDKIKSLSVLKLIGFFHFNPQNPKYTEGGITDGEYLYADVFYYHKYQRL